MTYEKLDPVCLECGRHKSVCLCHWPKCAVCGKGAREGKHAFDLGEGHEYVPQAEPRS